MFSKNTSGTKRRRTFSNSMEKEISLSYTGKQCKIIHPACHEKDQESATNGRNNHDKYCWKCHNMCKATMKFCASCPKVFHSRCLTRVTQFNAEGACHPCQLQSGRDQVFSFPISQLSDLMRVVLKIACEMDSSKKNHMTSIIDWPDYPSNTKLLCVKDLKYIFDKCTLQDIQYISPSELLEDMQWIYHNCRILHGKVSPITKNAENILNQLIEALDCPECYSKKNMTEYEFSLHICDSKNMNRSIEEQSSSIVHGQGLSEEHEIIDLTDESSEFSGSCLNFDLNRDGSLVEKVAIRAAEAVKVPFSSAVDEIPPVQQECLGESGETISEILIQQDMMSANTRGSADDEKKRSENFLQKLQSGLRALSISNPKCLPYDVYNYLLQYLVPSMDSTKQRVNIEPITIQKDEEIANLKKEIAKLKKENAKLKKNLEKLLKSNKSQLEKEKKRNSGLVKVNEEYKKKLSELEKKNEKQIKYMNEKEEKIEKQIKSMEQEKKRLEEHIKHINEINENLENKVKDLYEDNVELVKNWPRCDVTKTVIRKKVITFNGQLVTQMSHIIQHPTVSQACNSNLFSKDNGENF